MLDSVGIRYDTRISLTRLFLKWRYGRRSYTPRRIDLSGNAPVPLSTRRVKSAISDDVARKFDESGFTSGSSAKKALMNFVNLESWMRQLALSR